MTSECTLPASGKLAPELLSARILGHLGAKRDDVLVGPGVGEDAAVIAWGKGKYLVAASDPVVGAREGAGRLLVHINANDVACKGADPAHLLVTMILPRGWSDCDAERIMQDIAAACEEIGVAIVGGHTEFSDRYDTPVLSATMLGASDRLLAASNMRPGDLLLMTKHAGLEGMSILAADRPDLLEECLTPGEIEHVRSWANRLSVLPEARLLRSCAHFLHDPTEGGLLGGVEEVRLLAQCSFILDRNQIPIHPLTRKASEHLAFDPLFLISSGVLLAALPRIEAENATQTLQGESIESTIIGHLAEGPTPHPLPIREELWRLLSR